MAEKKKEPAYFMYFPGNYRWSAAFINMIGSIAYGGAEIGELHRIGRMLKDKGVHDLVQLAQALFFLLFLFRQVSLAFFELVVWFGQGITFDFGRADRSGVEIERARSPSLAANANDDPPSPPAGGQDGWETGYNLIAVAAAADAEAIGARARCLQAHLDELDAGLPVRQLHLH